MGKSIKWLLVVIAAAAVLIVLITPAPDELPCTISKHARYQPTFVAVIAILPLLSLLLSSGAYQSNIALKSSSFRDMLSSNCILLC